MKQWADGDTAELSDGAQVLCWKNRSRSHVRGFHIWSNSLHECSYCVTIKQSHDQHHTTWSDYFYSFTSFSRTCSVPHVQLSSPSVDQDPLSRARGTAYHSLTYKSWVPWDHQRMEACVQTFLAARVVPVVQIVHDALWCRTVRISSSTNPFNIKVTYLLQLPVCTAGGHQSGRFCCCTFQSLVGECAFPVHHRCTWRMPTASHFGRP